MDMKAIVRSCLEKLRPEAMMVDEGLKRASVALRLLQTKAADTKFPAALASIGGILLVVQTALLHPVAELRLGATTVLASCIQRDDPVFLREALLLAEQGRRLDDALIRLMREGDRRTQAQGTTEAIDPDLPTRRIALEAFVSLATKSCDPAVRAAVVSNPHAVSTLIELTSNSDPGLRLLSATLLKKLASEPSQLPAVRGAFEAAPDAETRAGMSGLLLRAALEDEEPEVSDSAASILLALRGCDVVRADVRNMEGALAVISAAAAAADEMKADRPQRAQMLREVVAWLAVDQPVEVGG